jgi:hypothetical protein
MGGKMYFSRNPQFCSHSSNRVLLTSVRHIFIWLLAILATVLASTVAGAQSVGNAGSISGTVVDQTGAGGPGATVGIHNPVSRYERTTTTDDAGRFNFVNIPVNPYHLTANKSGFSNYAQDVDVRSSVPVNLKVALVLGESSTTVNVESEAGDLLENDPTFHTDVDRGLFDKLPLESASSQLSSLVTLASPGVAADSNGLFHGLGDHAENSFSLDGQPITDQQSKVFANQIPLDAVQSMEVISGAPPAEYGGKTSLVIDVTTRSGLGVTQPHGAFTASYGTFGTVNGDLNFSYGGQKWGNFIAANGLNTGRFLDPPEFVVMHAKGNEENIFDRVDYQFSPASALHVNLGVTRSWFQNPNSFDNLNIGVTDPVNGNPVGPTDQRAQIKTFNIAPSWTRTLSSNAVLTVGGYVRRDQYNYYPSGNPFADLSPIQQESIAQDRNLTNAGVRSDLSYTKGIHNLKVGFVYSQTFINENDSLGIVDPALNDPASPNFNPLLACFDLTRPTPPPGSKCATAQSSLFLFHGHTDVKELGMYVQDSISVRNWTFNLGIRGDIYNGLSVARQAEPRLGVSYNIKRTNTVLRASYARTLESPFNENLVLSTNGCFDPVVAALVPCIPARMDPGFRNEFHAGLQQAFGKYLVVSGDYIWKYTHNAYDFSILGNTPIFFPISWHNSKIPGFALRVSVPNYHGLSALVVMSSVAARFFPPQVGGLGVTVGQSGFPFRIDHDEKFNQTMHLQYQTPWKRGPWIGFNWRYDSGLVAGAIPCFGTNPQNSCDASTTLNGQPAIDLSGFSADQQFQAGFICGSVQASPFTPLPSPCLASQFGSKLVSIPAPGTQNDDHNPARIAPRSLFDLAVGFDNLIKNDRYKVSLQFSAINLTNKYALYNFLSTFSGTHYVTPRALTAEVGFHF